MITEVRTHNWVGRVYSLGIRVGHPVVTGFLLRALKRRAENRPVGNGGIGVGAVLPRK